VAIIYLGRRLLDASSNQPGG